MMVRQVMTTNVQCVSPDTSVQDAARRMRDLDVGPLPVCDQDRLVGIITDRDIAVRCVAEGQDPRNSKVRDAMTPRVVYCYEDQPITEAARAMEAERVRRILVLDRNKRLVGIVSLADLAVDAGDDSLTAQMVEAVSEPARPRRTTA